MDFRKHGWRWTLRLTGLAGVLHETLLSTTDRPVLLTLFAALMGLDFFVRKDWNGRNGRSG